MPIIKIYRKRKWITRLRKMVIYLDGQKFSYIYYGETKEIDIAPGPHKLKVKMNLVESKELEFTMFNKEIRKFSIGINKGALSIILILVLVWEFLRYYFYKHHKPESSIPIVIILLPVLIAGALILFLKNSYLTIKEGIDN